MNTRARPFARLASMALTKIKPKFPSIPFPSPVVSTTHPGHTTLKYFSTDSSNNAPTTHPNVKVHPAKSNEDENTAPSQEEAMGMIEEILETRVRPAIVADGGDIHLVAWDADKAEVVVRLSGACVSCDRSTITMRMLVQNAMRHYLPWVTRVRREGGEEEHTVKVGVDKCLF